MRKLLSIGAICLGLLSAHVWADGQIEEKPTNNQANQNATSNQPQSYDEGICLLGICTKGGTPPATRKEDLRWYPFSRYVPKLPQLAFRAVSAVTYLFAAEAIAFTGIAYHATMPASKIVMMTINIILLPIGEKKGIGLKAFEVTSQEGLTNPVDGFRWNRAMYVLGNLLAQGEAQETALKAVQQGFDDGCYTEAIE